MRFKCGETDQKHRKAQERKDRLETWHPFFCLIPRKVADHDCRWLETIERRGHWVTAFDACDFWLKLEWEYRA